MIKAIVFDYFDVFRPDGYKRWLTDHGFKRTGRFLDASEKHDRGDCTTKEFIDAVALASNEAPEQVEKEMESDIELNYELVEFVRRLRKKYKVALLSNSASKYLRDELKRHNLERHFDEIIISSEVKLIKPDPEVFKYILNKLQIEPEECVFVDDNPDNVSAAEELGIYGLVYTGIKELKIRLIQTLDEVEQHL